MNISKSEQSTESLVEFYNAWPELRTAMLDIENGQEITATQADTIKWMVLLIDRLGPSDISFETGKTPN